MIKAEVQWLQRNDLTRLDYDARYAAINLIHRYIIWYIYHRMVSRCTIGLPPNGLPMYQITKWSPDVPNHRLWSNFESGGAHNASEASTRGVCQITVPGRTCPDLTSIQVYNHKTGQLNATFCSYYLARLP